MKRIVILLLVLMSLYSCNNPFKKTTTFIFNNKTDIVIRVSQIEDRDWAQKWIKDYPVDTTIESLLRRRGSFVKVLPFSTQITRYRFESFEDWIPDDANIIPFFVVTDSLYSFYYANKLEDFVKGGYLVRYDLTIDDIYELLMRTNPYVFISLQMNA